MVGLHLNVTEYKFLLFFLLAKYVWGNCPDRLKEKRIALWPRLAFESVQRDEESLSDRVFSVKLESARG